MYKEITFIFQGLGVSDDNDLPDDTEALKGRISEIFLTRTRDEWASVFEVQYFLRLRVDW